MLIVFSFLAGYESFYQGIEAGRQQQPVQDSAGVGQAAQRKLMRMADRPFAVAVLFLAIMLVVPLAALGAISARCRAAIVLDRDLRRGDHVDFIKSAVAPGFDSVTV